MQRSNLTTPGDPTSRQGLQNYKLDPINRPASHNTLNFAEAPTSHHWATPTSQRVRSQWRLNLRQQAQRRRKPPEEMRRAKNTSLLFSSSDSASFNSQASTSAKLPECQLTGSANYRLPSWQLMPGYYSHWIPLCLSCDVAHVTSRYFILFYFRVWSCCIPSCDLKMLIVFLFWLVNWPLLPRVTLVNQSLILFRLFECEYLNNLAFLYFCFTLFQHVRLVIIKK